MPWWGKKDSNTGHIDDMSDRQEEALYELTSKIEELGLTEDTRYNGEYLLRFLRANNFKVDKTLKMFIVFLEWREEVNADQAMVIYRFPELSKIKKYYEHGYHKTDREGRPVWVDRPCEADIDACYDLITPDMMMKYYIAEYENLIHCKLPACSAAKGDTVDSTF